MLLPMTHLTRPVFSFEGYAYAPETGTLTLTYRHPGAEEFVETLQFLDAPVSLNEAQRAALDRAFRQLHFAAGVSYYKACLAPRIAMAQGAMSEAEAEFFREFYVEGLAEFAYTNGLDLRGRVSFPFSAMEKDAPSDMALPRRTIVPVGGGKDSIVSIESLRAAGEPIVLFGMGDAAPIVETLAVAALSAIRVKRKIAPALLSLNAAGAYNGHVPITGILSFILPVLAILYGADAAAMSNERSASVGNLTRDGQVINHQWSKGEDFERSFKSHVQRTVHLNFDYYSLLRPLSELAIAQRFARQERYFSCFNSCNRNFSQTRPRPGWCGDCPKCRFVFLALAPFMARQKLEAIFGKGMLDDRAQEAGYRELLGLIGHKPFECVGEIEESRVALRLLAGQPEWAGAPLVARLAVEAGGALSFDAPEVRAVLQPEGGENLPPRLRSLFAA